MPICDNCGIRFEDMPTTHRVEGNHIFCSKSCSREHYQKWFFVKSVEKKRISKLIKDIKNCSLGIDLLFNGKVYRIENKIPSFRSVPKIKKEPKKILEPIQKGSCCTILKSHAESLKGDPERLSTDFIKSLSQCNCDKITYTN